MLLITALAALAGGAASPARAAVITGLSLERNHQTSRLVITAGGPLAYRVDLDDPQTVVVTLKDASLAAPLPQTAGDPVVAEVTAETQGQSLNLVVRTRAPGVTVLPLYEADRRRLTLELGGAPVVEQKVAQPQPAPQAEAAAPAPSPAAKPPTQPASAPPKEQAPAPKQAPAKAAAPTPAPAPAKAAPAAPSGPPPVVLGVRMGTHADYTRVVLDADRPLEAEVSRQDQALVITTQRGKLKPGAGLPRGDRRVRGLEVVSPDPFRLRVALARPVKSFSLFRSGDGGLKTVLDLALVSPAQAERMRAEAAARRQAATPRAQEAKAEAEAKADLAKVVNPAKLRTEPEMPVAEPSLAQEEAEVAAETPAPPPPVKDETPSAPPRPAAQGPAPLTLTSPALPAPDGAQARGRMPPVPPPSALARPRGQAAKADAGRDHPAESARQVMGRIEQAPPAAPAPATAPTPGVAPGAAPAGPDQRPPQAARLGELGKQDAEARKLLDKAKLALDTRDYASAQNLFEMFLQEFPKHPLAQEATFRAADAFFYLHERDMAPNYDLAMEKYQRAIDLYPDSDQVPWALLQMGRTAMLGGEPYKATGYFQLVVEDYPKSEYVPLALVNQGRSLLADNRWGAALDLFREVADNHPDSRYRKDADWGQAQALFGMARYERASLLLQDMDRRYPGLRLEEPELLYYIGEAEFQLKRYAQARRYFLWALNVMPDIRDNDIILTRVGDTYQFEGALAAAKNIYTMVVNRFPDTDGGLVARIRLAESPAKDQTHPWDIFQVKATLDAQKTYQEILDKYPDRQVAQLAQLKLGVYHYKKKEYPQALATLEELLNKDPRTAFRPEVEYTLDLAAADYLALLRQQDKPLDLMDAYLRNRANLRRPNSNQMLEMLAWAYGRSGLNQRAAKLYTVLISRGLNKPEHHLELAANLMAEGDYQGVVSALDPGNVQELKGSAKVQAQSLKGRALARLGKCGKAEPFLAWALQQKQPSPWITQDYMALGRCLANLGRPAQALDALDKADLNLGPEEKLDRYLVAMDSGRAARAAGDEERALAYFQRAAKAAQTKQDRVQAQYEVAGSLMKLKRYAEMAKIYKELAAAGVQPWADMAKRHMQDMNLAPQLKGVGSGPQDQAGQ